MNRRLTASLLAVALMTGLAGCSSVTSFERHGGAWREVDYAEPAATGGAVDVGAV